MFLTAMWLAKGTIVIVAFLFEYGVSTEQRKYNIRLTKYANGCPEQKLLLKFMDVVLYRDTLSFKAEAFEDIEGDLKFEFTIERCLNRDSPSTCEKYHTLRIPNFCQVLTMGVWSSFINGTTPQWTCPPKKGLYVMKSSLIPNLNDFSAIAITGNYYWKVNIKTRIQDTNTLIMCINVEVETYFA